MRRWLGAFAVGLALVLVSCGNGKNGNVNTSRAGSIAATAARQATSATASPTLPAAPSAAATAAPTAAAGAGIPTSRIVALTDAPAAGKGSGNVQVLYAASLTSLMENTLGPAFDRATGYTFQGEGKGSVALANEIKDKLRQPDVFISADPSVNNSLAGAANGDLADWYVVWGRTTIVIGYNPKSPFAAQLTQAKDGKIPWYTVLEMPGLKLGRTDPQIDPKGYRTLWMFDLAQKYYQQPGLRQRILGADNNTAQIFPEEELVSRLESGQLDAGIFYLSEVAGLKLPHINLPDQINQGNPALAAYYSQESYTNRKGVTTKGSPILYTATQPSVAKNVNGGLAFIQDLATSTTRATLQANGILPTNLLAGGDASKIPAQLKPYLKGAYQP